MTSRRLRICWIGGRTSRLSEPSAWHRFASAQNNNIRFDPRPTLPTERQLNQIKSRRDAYISRQGKHLASRRVNTARTSDSQYVLCDTVHRTRHTGWRE